MGKQRDIIALVKIFKTEDPSLTMDEIRDRLVFTVGFDPSVVDYFITRL